jgi:hypothetical protein
MEIRQKKLINREQRYNNTGLRLKNFFKITLFFVYCYALKNKMTFYSTLSRTIFLQNQIFILY